MQLLVGLPVLGTLVGSPVTGSSVSRPVKSLTSGLSVESGRLGLVGGVPLSGNGTLDGTLNGGVASNGSGGLLGGLGLDLVWVSVEEQVREDGPRLTADGSSETEDLSAEQVPDETNGVTGLVVTGDGNVDELQGSIGVTEGDDRDVDVGSLPDGLVVDTRVGDDDDPGLLERSGDVVGERTRGESSSNGLSTGEPSVLQDSSVTVGTSGDDTDVVGVVDGGEDSGSKDDLLPSLSDVDDVDSVAPSLVQVVEHGLVTVLASQVGTRSKKQFEIFRLQLQHVRGVLGVSRHLGWNVIRFLRSTGLGREFLRDLSIESFYDSRVGVA